MAVYCSVRDEPMAPVITRPVLMPMPMRIGSCPSAVRVRLNSFSARFTSPVWESSFARSRTITSESEVVMNAHPLRESSSRRRPAFTMSPLWPRAMSPYAVEATMGCALSRMLEPVVE